MINFEEFKVKMLNEFRKEYVNAFLKKDSLVIEEGTIEATVSMQDAYEEYKLAKDFKFICDIFKKTLKEEFQKRRFKIDYTKVFPLIKSKDFGLGESTNFLRDELFLDLNILYAMDMGETFRFILIDDKYDYRKLKESAYKNLEMVSTGLVKLDKDLDIYSVAFLTDYSSSFILLNSMKQQIQRKVGSNHLLAIPSSTSLLVARNSYKYIDLLKTLIGVDPDPHKVSRHIYRFKDGHYEYAERKQIFTIIK
ncbi:DUF1444 family protein [Alkalithermobacter paradoxus]|uniref:DUF1444 domain-containing protein n=2 Tax=Clostridia TaxID=186801 RepID=A0A1V4I455_9FIRM|nr:hypothetical protein CLOTH_19770 [[Clostridium] thermoalcaliphilum]